MNIMFCILFCSFSIYASHDILFTIRKMYYVDGHNYFIYAPLNKNLTL